MRQSYARRSSKLANLLIALGLVFVMSPVLWSLKASILQYWEVMNWRKPSAPSASQLPKCAIVIPKLNLNAVVVESDLDRGPMHVAGTGLPGQIGNCCIAAHKEKWFHGLKKLGVGDTAVVHTSSARYVYRIISKIVVRADEVWIMGRTPTPVLTLITCTGPAYFGRGKGRLVVMAALVETKSFGK